MCVRYKMARLRCVILHIRVRDSGDSGSEWSKRPARGRLVIEERVLLTAQSSLTYTPTLLLHTTASILLITK